jgi:HAMP domain-containing protein
VAAGGLPKGHGAAVQDPALLALGVVPLVVLGYVAYQQVGSGFMPHMDEGGFVLDYRAPPGTSLAETDRLLRQVEKILQQNPAVQTYSRRTGTQLGGGLTEANEGDFFVRLKPLPRPPIDSVMDDIRRQIESKVPGLDTEMALLMEDLRLCWTTSRFVDAQLAAGLRHTLDALERAHGELDMHEFRALVNAQLRSAPPNSLHILFADRQGNSLAGDLKGWPVDFSADGKVYNVVYEDTLISGRAEDQDAYWPTLGRELADGHRLPVAHGMEQAESLLDFTRGTMALILEVSFALAVGLGLLQGRTLLGRIDTLIDTARVIGAGRLHRRVPLSGQNDEFDELAEQLNSMFEIHPARQSIETRRFDRRRPGSRQRQRQRPGAGHPGRATRAGSHALRATRCGAQYPGQRVGAEPGKGRGQTA